MPFGHASPAPFGGTLPKGEGLGVVVLNNHLPRQIGGVEFVDKCILRKYNIYNSGYP